MHVFISSLAAIFLGNCVLAATTPAPVSAPSPISLPPVLDETIQGIGNAPPPPILWTPKPSPECATINAGELQCCQGTLAGDLPLVKYLATAYGFELNPNDLNGISCKLGLAIYS